MWAARLGRLWKSNILDPDVLCSVSPAAWRHTQGGHTRTHAEVQRYCIPMHLNPSLVCGSPLPLRKRCPRGSPAALQTIHFGHLWGGRLVTSPQQCCTSEAVEAQKQINLSSKFFPKTFQPILVSGKLLLKEKRGKKPPEQLIKRRQERIAAACVPLTSPRANSFLIYHPQRG